jgi:hypothetical protein
LKENTTVSAKNVLGVACTFFVRFGFDFYQYGVVDELDARDHGGCRANRAKDLPVGSSNFCHVFCPRYKDAGPHNILECVTGLTQGVFDDAKGCERLREGVPRMLHGSIDGGGGARNVNGVSYDGGARVPD